MYIPLIKKFLQSKTVWLVFTILMLLGIASIQVGKQFLLQKQNSVNQAITEQEKEIRKQTNLHQKDLGLLLYYLKFSFIKKHNPLAGLAIGQSDLNPHIQNIGILNLEGQKYDTDLVNPMCLQVGNLDLSFVIIFLLPLVIIALNFNVLSEEIENGTWKLIRIQANSAFIFLLQKISIKLFFVSSILGFLFLIAKYSLQIPLDINFIYFIILSYLYLLFWFVVCFFVISFKKSTNSNAIILLVTWLFLVVFLPVVINNHITNKYPLDKAFAMTIKQRDGYHKKWDTDKKETLEAFYKHYPQFASYGIKEKGFSWLWYYAMQQMGDDTSKLEQEAMYATITKRVLLTAKMTAFFPVVQVQLSMNELANTSLKHQIEFLHATTGFHENLRLQFYPKIFNNENANSIEWNTLKSVFFISKLNTTSFKNSVVTLIFIGVFFLLGSIIFFKIN
ncbi:DUF3526 domain-containing protein [Tenacibaculum salmonis]|uniref:DUF3526 domain-containing protein n=1 Tax=Tenacibaculum sp. P3-BQ1 TaxID=3232310 RepID=UPI0034DE8174